MAAVSAADTRETESVPADWRRSAWGLLVGLVGFAFASANWPASASALAFGGGMLLVGLAVGWTDHIVAREQRRLTETLRNYVSRT